MIDRLIELSLRNRFLVVALWVGIAGWGLWAMLRAPIDAIPDLSDNQVIVFTDWSGRSPQEVEDQVTYPLTVNLQGLPGVKVVRSSSAFGFSMIFVIFEDNVDLYFARTRVLERLNLVTKQLPAGVELRGNEPGGVVGRQDAVIAEAFDGDVVGQPLVADVLRLSLRHRGAAGNGNPAGHVAGQLVDRADRIGPRQSADAGGGERIGEIHERVVRGGRPACLPAVGDARRVLVRGAEQRGIFLPHIDLRQRR